jgi:glyceraldehyde-3-phosphate dehydrogenase/erythrose-4-phosphate dehydrogenase
MTRYYFNENPQVTLWREQAKKHEDVKLFLEIAYDHEVDYNKRLVEKLKQEKKAMRDFNSLPWWRKMFYKFRL